MENLSNADLHRESKTEKAKRFVFGIAVGIAAVLLIDTVWLLAIPGWGGLWIIWTAPLHFIIGAVAGILLAWRRWMYKTAWWVTALFVILVWPLCIAAPIKIRSLQFSWIAAHVIPTYPGAERTQMTKKLYGGDNPPRVRIELRSYAPSQKIIRYYQEELVRRGWKELPPKVISDLTYYRFEKSSRSLDIVTEGHGIYIDWTPVCNGWPTCEH